MRRNTLYRLGLVAILSGGIGFMSVAADHRGEATKAEDLDGLKGPVHALDEIHEPRDKPPSAWI